MTGARGQSLADVDSDSRKTRSFIIQGITGREAVNLTRENLDYGAKIIGGVTPGRAGRDIYGVPVYDWRARRGRGEGRTLIGRQRSSPYRRNSRRTPSSKRSRTASKLIVVVTENIPRKRGRRQAVELGEAPRRPHHRTELPRHHLARRSARWAVWGVRRRIPARRTRRGHIGIMSRSGGMTTEIASTLTAAGHRDSRRVSRLVGTPSSGRLVRGTDATFFEAGSRRRTRSRSTPSPVDAWKPSWPNGCK